MHTRSIGKWEQHTFRYANKHSQIHLNFAAIVCENFNLGISLGLWGRFSHMLWCPTFLSCVFYLVRRQWISSDRVGWCGTQVTGKEQLDIHWTLIFLVLGFEDPWVSLITFWVHFLNFWLCEYLMIGFLYAKHVCKFFKCVSFRIFCFCGVANICSVFMFLYS